MKYIFVLVVFLINSAFAQEVASKVYDRMEGDPLKFVRELMVSSELGDFVVINAASKPIFSEIELSSLLLMIDSKVECCSVKSTYSDKWSLPKSTIGNEVAYLLWGHISNNYPPSASSLGAHDLYREKIAEWAREKLGIDIKGK